MSTPVMDTATRSLDLTREALHQCSDISDPLERLRQVALLTDEITSFAKSMRDERDQAATALHVWHGWKRVRVYQLIGVARGLFHKITDRNPEDVLDDKYRDEGYAEKIATIYSDLTVQRWDALAKQARSVRNDTIRELITARDDDGQRKYRNRDMQRVTGYSSARMATIKKRLGLNDDDA